MRWRWPRSSGDRGRARCCWLATPAFAIFTALQIISGSAGEPNGIWKQSETSSGLQTVAIFGPDDRIPLPPTLRPLREMLGVLFNVQQRTVCSAFCIAPAIIGTAAHCLYKTKGEKPPRLADFWFARNYDSVRDYSRIAGYETGSAGQQIIAGSVKLSTAPPIDATKDWAFVRLSTPVCSKGAFEIQPLPVEQIIRESRAGRVYQVSYHKDFKQWQPAYSKPCHVERSFPNATWQAIAADFDTPDNLILHTCDTGGASSGSPILLDTDKGPRVIGINVGTYVQSRSIVHEDHVIEKAGTDSVANTAVAASAFANQLAAFRNARILAGSAAIREVQERLKKIGYYNGPIDGTYGPHLKLAIDDYESSMHLPITGLAREELLAHLRSNTKLPDKTQH